MDMSENITINFVVGGNKLIISKDNELIIKDYINKPYIQDLSHYLRHLYFSRPLESSELLQGTFLSIVFVCIVHGMFI